MLKDREIRQRALGCLGLSLLMHSWFLVAAVTFTGPSITEITEGALPALGLQTSNPDVYIPASTEGSTEPVPTAIEPEASIEVTTADDVLVKPTLSKPVKQAKPAKQMKAALPAKALPKIKQKLNTPPVVLPAKVESKIETPEVAKAPEPITPELETADDLDAPAIIPAIAKSDSVDEPIAIDEEVDAPSTASTSISTSTVEKEVEEEVESTLASLIEEAEQEEKRLAEDEIADEIASEANSEAAPGRNRGTLPFGIPTGVRNASDLLEKPGNIPPQYPLADRRAGREGTVVFIAYVNPDGSVRADDIRMERTSRSRTMDTEAHQAMRRWKFQPGQQGWVRKEFTFSLKGKAQDDYTQSQLRRR